VVSSELTQGEPIARIELACTSDGELFDEPDPIDFELSIELESGKLPGLPRSRSAPPRASPRDSPILRAASTAATTRWASPFGRG